MGTTLVNCLGSFLFFTPSYLNSFISDFSNKFRLLSVS